MAYYLPGKVRLHRFTINGYDMRLHIKCAKIFETMCKPYFTGQFIIVDNNNVINGLKLSGGEPISYAWSGGDGMKVYEDTQYIVSIDGEESTESSRTQVYTIHTCSMSYFRDKGSLVQRADMLIPATAAAAAIHNEYIGGSLSVDAAAAGMVAQMESGGYQTMNTKPFKAIEDLLSRCSYAGFKSGSGIYFKAYDSFHMGPLEYYFSSCSSQQDFEQRATWGSEYQHVWTTTNAIIAARTVKNEDNSGRAGGDGAAAAKGALNIHDVSQGIEVAKKMASAASSGGIIGSSGSSMFGGKGGGIQNVLSTDKRRNPLSVEQALNSVTQNSFQAKVKNGVNYLIKVPIQSGIYVTVGKGINAKLLPPVGDQNKGRSLVGGLMLVADVMHECWFDDRLIQATTTMRAVSGLKT